MIALINDGFWLLVALIAAATNFVVFARFSRLTGAARETYRHLIAAHCRRSALRMLAAAAIGCGLYLSVPPGCPSSCRVILQLLAIVLLWTSIADWRTWLRSERIGNDQVDMRGRR